MEDGQQRLIEEKEELDNNRVKLLNFCRGEAFAALPADYRDLLNLQYDAMTVLSGVLQERIDRF